MRAVPVFHCSDIARSVAFYMEVLDFQWRYPAYRELSLSNGVVDLVRDAAVVQLSIHMGNAPFGSSANLELEQPREVDELFELYKSRGLNQSHRIGSPVHLAPLDQTWGTREFYINDPDGNCLCLRAWR